MSDIPGGSIVTVVVGDAHTTLNLNANDVVNAVGAELSSQYDQVKTATESGGWLSNITPLIQETFQATFTLKPKFDTTTDDLAARVSQAFSDVTEQNSNQITIPSYTVPGSLTPQSTGEPAAQKTATQSISDSVSGFFSTLKTGTIGLFVGLGAIIILVLILVAFGPNVGEAIKAVA